MPTFTDDAGHVRLPVLPRRVRGALLPATASWSRRATTRSGSRARPRRSAPIPARLHDPSLERLLAALDHLRDRLEFSSARPAGDHEVLPLMAVDFDLPLRERATARARSPLSFGLRSGCRRRSSGAARAPHRRGLLGRWGELATGRPPRLPGRRRKEGQAGLHGPGRQPRRRHGLASRHGRGHGRPNALANGAQHLRSRVAALPLSREHRRRAGPAPGPARRRPPATTRRASGTARAGVRLDRVPRDVEPVADLPLREVRGEEAENIELSGGRGPRRRVSPVCSPRRPPPLDPRRRGSARIPALPDGVQPPPRLREVTARAVEVAAAHADVGEHEQCVEVAQFRIGLAAEPLAVHGLLLGPAKAALSASAAASATLARPQEAASSTSAACAARIRLARPLLAELRASLPSRSRQVRGSPARRRTRARGRPPPAGAAPPAPSTGIGVLARQEAAHGEACNAPTPISASSRASGSVLPCDRDRLTEARLDPGRPGRPRATLPHGGVQRSGYLGEHARQAP